jgi:hypothetical protein
VGVGVGVGAGVGEDVCWPCLSTSQH